MFMQEVYPISSVLARKNSPACYHTGEFVLILINYSSPHSQNRIYDAFLNNMLTCYLLMVVTSPC